MKFLLPILCVLAFSSVNAQTEALFTKGAELEYKTYLKRVAVGSMKLVECTTITLVVTDVRDSNNVTYSFITKKAHAATDPDLNYQRNVVASKTGNIVTLPLDLFSADTIYLADMGVKGKKGKKTFATTQYGNNASMRISGSNLSPTFEYLPKTYTASGMTTATNTDFGSPLFDSPMENAWKIDATVKDISPVQKASITTPAGKFDCFKIKSHTEMKISSFKKDVAGTVYFSDQYGLIKTESEDDAGHCELVRVKI